MITNNRYQRIALRTGISLLAAAILGGIVYQAYPSYALEDSVVVQSPESIDTANNPSDSSPDSAEQERQERIREITITLLHMTAWGVIFSGLGVLFVFLWDSPQKK